MARTKTKPKTKPKSKVKTRKSEKQQKIEAQYYKEQRRIKDYLRKLARENIFSNYEILPEEPKRITEGSVRKLKAITAQKILEKSVYINPETGEIISTALERRYEKKQEGIEKGKRTRALKKKQNETKQNYKEWLYNDNEENFVPPSRQAKISYDDVVIANFEMSLNRWPQDVADKVKSFIQRLIDEDEIEKSDVSQMIVNSQGEGVNFRLVNPYSDQAVKNYLAEMLEFLPEIDDMPFLKETLLTEIEQMTYENEGWDTSIM